jgi:hypothetical protein
VYFVSTAGHGGVIIQKASPTGLRLSPLAKVEAIDSRHAWAFEEDCKYAVAFWELMEQGLDLSRLYDKTPEAIKQGLLESLSFWNLPYLEAKGITPDPKGAASYRARKDRDTRRAAKDPDTITSAQRVEGDSDLTQVWTADGKAYLVTGYPGYSEEGPRLSACDQIVKEVRP